MGRPASPLAGLLQTLRWSRGRLPAAGRGGFLIPLALLGALLLGLCGLVTAVDPYGLYPWGAPLKVTSDRYSNVARPWLANAIAQDDVDTVVVGGSTAEQFVAGDVEATLAGTRHAAILTYLGPRPRDLMTVLERLDRSPHLKRIILSYDISWTQTFDGGQPAFPFALYDDNPINDLNLVSPQSLELSLNLVRTGALYRPAWSRARVEATESRAYDTAQTPQRATLYRGIMAAQRAGVDAPTRLTCADFPAIAALADQTARMTARGVAFDIVIPPYSYFAYYDFSRPERRYRLRGEPAMAVFLESRRCLLAAVANQPGVRVFGYDLDAPMVEDMANYRDGSHLHDRRWGVRMLQAMARGEGRLTARSFEPYAAELRRRVVAYQYRNSRLAP